MPSKFFGTPASPTESTFDSSTASVPGGGTAAAHGGLPRGTYGTGYFRVVAGSGYKDDPYIGVYTQLLTTGASHNTVVIPVMGNNDTVGRITSWGVNAVTPTTPFTATLSIPIAYNATPDTLYVNLGVLAIGTNATEVSSFTDWTEVNSDWFAFSPDNKIADWVTGTGALPYVDLDWLGHTAGETVAVVIHFEWFDKVRV